MDNGVKSSRQENAYGTTHHIVELKIPVPWGHIAARAWGNPQNKPVLTVHGIQDNAASFDLLIPLLPNNQYYFVCVDLPGHGFSSHIPLGIPYRVTDYFNALFRVVKYFEWEELIFMGHSLGAIIGLFFANLYPQLVKKIILIDLTSFHNFPRKFHPHLLKGIVKNELAFEQKTLSNSPPSYTYEEALGKLSEGKVSKLSPRGVEVLLSRELVPVPNKENRYYLSKDQRLKFIVFPLIEDKHYLKMVAEIKCPVLLILGSQSGARFMPLAYSVQKILKNNCSEFHFHLVEGNHCVHISHPERVAPLINRFIQGGLKSSL